MSSYASDQESSVLRELDIIAATLSREFQPDTFEEKYRNWRNSWSSGLLLISSRSEDRAQGPEWEALVGMGPYILPRVVEKLKHVEDQFAVHLYDQLQPDATKKVDEGDHITYYVLQNRAAKIRQLYATKVLAPFLSKASDWHAQQFSPDHESHRSLAAMNKDEITPLVMAKYAQDQNSRWYQLLNELHPETRPTPQAVSPQEEYEKWKRWFQEQQGRNAAQAP